MPASASSTEPQQPPCPYWQSPRQRAPDGPHAGHQAPRLGHHAALALGTLAPHSRGLTAPGARPKPEAREALRQRTGGRWGPRHAVAAPSGAHGSQPKGCRPRRRRPRHPTRGGGGAAPPKVGPGRPPPPFIGPVGGALGPLPVAQPPGPCKGHARPAGASPAGCRARQPLQGHRGGRLRRLPRRCSGARAAALAGPP